VLSMSVYYQVSCSTCCHMLLLLNMQRSCIIDVLVTLFKRLFLSSTTTSSQVFFSVLEFTSSCPSANKTLEEMLCKSLQRVLNFTTKKFRDTNINDLFQECVHGALKDKTILLVTHQVDFLHNANLILVSR
jgi:hypothetical protein